MVLLTLERSDKYIENQYNFILIKFDGDVKVIHHRKILSREEFELECILYLDSHSKSYEIDNFMYIENEEVKYTYNYQEENKKLK